MNFEFEIYIDEKTGKKMVFVSACDGASGAEYPYKTAKDIGKAIAKYLSTYYSEAVKTAGWDMTDVEPAEDDDDDSDVDDPFANGDYWDDGCPIEDDEEIIP